MPINISPVTAMNKLDKQSPYMQIALGAAGGIVTGFVLLRIGKLVAICLGATILTFELAVQTGMIAFDWEKFVDNGRSQAQATNIRTMSRRPSNNANHCDRDTIDQVIAAVLSSARFSVAFLGGFLLGFGMA